MSVIFEQGSAGRTVWHEACDPKNRKLNAPRIARASGHERARGRQAPPRRLLEIEI